MSPQQQKQQQQVPLSVAKEHSGLSRSDGKRPDRLIPVPRQNGKALFRYRLPVSGPARENGESGTNMPRPARKKIRWIRPLRVCSCCLSEFESCQLFEFSHQMNAFRGCKPSFLRSLAEAYK